jgi:serine phosphatase RsbU (regulator of sigma subunit)
MHMTQEPYRIKCAGLLDSLNRNAELSPAELKNAILADLQRHRGECPPDDDVTLLIAEVS